MPDPPVDALLQEPCWIPFRRQLRQAHESLELHVLPACARNDAAQDQDRDAQADQRVIRAEIHGHQRGSEGEQGQRAGDHFD